MLLKTLILSCLLFLAGCSQGPSAEKLKEAAQRIADGSAVLVDVREPSEWAETGVAEPAYLLSRSSLEEGSGEWRSFLEQNKSREILLICRTGNRAGQIARALTQQGIHATNLGGFSAWKKAGLPTREVR
jgi:rhodanese-related sulfurtransferase